MGGFFIFIIAIIVFIVLFVVSVGLSLLRGIFNLFTGNSRNSQPKNGNPFYGNNNDNTSNTTKTNNNGEKIFSKEEGEYVDFEEYKQEDSDNQH